MKKSISILLVIVCLCSFNFVVAQAKVGDRIGEALNTDIVAYVNHYAIPSYAVNGQSVVVAEDLRNFGFDVVWDGENRALYITRNQNTDVQTMQVDKSAVTGSVFADILETDIRVFANDKQITSYAMNGYTMIPIEELNMFGEVTWSNEERAIKLWVDGLHISPEKQSVIINTVSVYNLNAEELKILPAQVEQYKAAGWYPYDDFVCEWAKKLSREQGYEAAVRYLQDKIYSAEYAYGATATAAQFATLSQLYQNWYATVGVPVVIMDSYITYNSIDTPEANIRLWNISGKEITAFELMFTCYDAYGNITTDYSIYNGNFNGWVDDADMAVGEESVYTWALYSNSRTKSIRNIYMTKVAFSDGTYWSR